MSTIGINLGDLSREIKKEVKETMEEIKPCFDQPVQVRKRKNDQHGPTNIKKVKGGAISIKRAKERCCSDNFAYTSLFYDRRYYPVEPDIRYWTYRNVYKIEPVTDDEFVPSSPSHFYRVNLPSVVTLSPNDKAKDLFLNSELNEVIGHEGYAIALATHPVSQGRYYYEVEFLDQPKTGHTIEEQCHIRIGWSQIYSVLEAPVGYGPYSYSVRSKYGTKFYNGSGKTYMKDGFKQGDVLGCLIDLPDFKSLPKEFRGMILPYSHKNCELRWRRAESGDLSYWFVSDFMKEKEMHDREMKSVLGSKIEFFKNGISCGVAFTDINSGHYYPAVSLYFRAKIKCNFGPPDSPFKFPPPEGVKPMSARAEEMAVEQALSDMLYTVENEEKLLNDEEEFRKGTLVCEEVEEE